MLLIKKENYMTCYESRKRAWTKYNHSKKARISRSKYYKTEKSKNRKRRFYLKNKEKILKENKAWYLKNIEKFRSYRRKWAKSEKGKLSAIRYSLKNREKRLAKDIVNNALRSGKLKKNSCLICGNKKSQGHHPDYSNPLKVIWLCKKHHTEEHMKK